MRYWMNLYADGSKGLPWDTRDEADRNSRLRRMRGNRLKGHRVAVIRVTLKDGAHVAPAR